MDWAFDLTKDTPAPQIALPWPARNAKYPEEAAHHPPFVLKGDHLSASTFWHGKLLSQWAHDWVTYHTDSKGTDVTTAMEDTGTLQSLTWLAHAHKLDINRVLVLRTASNFDQQRIGATAAESLAETKVRQYSAYLPSLDSAYRVGHIVVDYLVANWPQTRDHLPTKIGIQSQATRGPMPITLQDRYTRHEVTAPRAAGPSGRTSTPTHIESFTRSRSPP